MSKVYDAEENLVISDRKTFGEKETKKALDDLQVYISGKASVDQKATENQEWWGLRYWGVMLGQGTNEGSREGYNVGSAWAVNSLLNKHADIMDSFPKPNILPREADDEQEAKLLTSIVPSILEQNDYEEIYRRMAWDVCIDGCAITGVFWDSSKHDGMGDVTIQNVDVHNLFWEPGIQDLQDSDKVYYVYLEDIDYVTKRYPKLKGKIGPQDSGMVTKYLHDDDVDTSHCVEVVNMYYKRPEIVPVYMDGVTDDGQQTRVKIHEVPRMVLHLAIIVGDQLVFCSENEKGYENGFYNHGKYPFIIRRLFPKKDTPWGFGYLDIMKNPQRDIDKLDQAIIRNALMKVKPRYWVKKNANIAVEDFADWNNELVEVGTGDLGESIRRIDVDDVPSGAMSHLMNKIDELKETSGNRDFSQGSTQSGVTAASAIAALQEAGSKLSRDINKEIYRGSREEYYLVIELIRQFYTEPRSFRVQEPTGNYRFLLWSNAGIVDHDEVMPDGSVRHRQPVFDILVTAEKQSPFSRAAQNELVKELYGMGLFVPENAIPALVCIDMMDFEGKDKLKQQIQQNAVMLQQFQAAMQIIQQAAMAIPQIGQMAMQAGLIDPEQMAQMAIGAGEQRAEEEASMQAPGVQEKRQSYADRIRERSANAAQPQ